MSEPIKFKALTKHDKGRCYITVVDTSMVGAIKQIMDAELCPERSILSIRRLKGTRFS